MTDETAAITSCLSFFFAQKTLLKMRESKRGSFFLFRIKMEERSNEMDQVEKLLLQALQLIGWKMEDFVNFVHGGKPKSPLSLENQEHFRKIGEMLGLRKEQKV